VDGPLFVKIDNYKQVNELIVTIKQRIVESKDLLKEIDTLKKQEDAHLEKWKQGIAELEKRTQNIKGILYNVKS